MILTPELLEAIKKRLGGLKDPVKLIAFSSDKQGIHGKHIESLAEEMATLSPKVNAEIYSLEKNPDMTEKYKVDKAPALILENIVGKQARFFGLPAGAEFNVFLSDLVDLSKGRPDLPDEIERKVKEITTPMHLQVFVNDGCPYCPGMVKLTHGLAMLNPHIRADMIRIEEFRSLADKYKIMGVPNTVINDKVSFKGAIPSDLFLKKLKEMQKKD